MRILHLSSARNFSGTERHMVDLCRGLAERGHEVFAMVRPTCDWLDRLSFLPDERVLKISIRSSFGVLSAIRIAEFVRDNAIEVVHAHTPRDYIPASIACRAAPNAKFVLTRHMLSPLKSFNRFALQNLGVAIGVSGQVGSELRHIFPKKKIKVIQNGLDLGHMRDRAELRKQFREFHEIAPEVPLVGTLGELREAKGQRDLVLAAAEVVKKVPQCVLVIAGLDHTLDRSFRRELRRLAGVLGLSENVIWLDWLDDTGPFYAALDVFVSPSHSESFGLAILEAMMRGTPVVATDTAGSRELLGPKAKLVPVGDPVKLGESICKMLEDNDRFKVGDDLRRLTMEKFSLEKMLDATERVYERL